MDLPRECWKCKGLLEGEHYCPRCDGGEQIGEMLRGNVPTRLMRILLEHPALSTKELRARLLRYLRGP